MSTKAASAQTAHQHLQELRVRVLYWVLYMGAGGAAGYVYREAIISFIQQPLHQSLYYTSPTGSFDFIVQVCMIIGFLTGVPAMVYNILRFIEPAFTRKFSWKLITFTILSSVTLLVGGVGFGYYVSLPAALHFFSTVGGSDLHAMITIDRYFNFMLGYLAVFGALFQLPLLLLLIDHMKPMGPKPLRKYRKMVFITAFAIPIILPIAPDIMSQVMLAVPLILLYEVSIALLTVRSWTRKDGRAVPAPIPQPVVTPVVAPSRPARVAPRPAQLQPARLSTRQTLDLRELHKQAEARRPATPRNLLDLRTAS